MQNTLAMQSYNKFSCVVVGEGPLALSCADALLNRGHEIRALVCTDPVLKRFANEKNIPCYQISPGLPADLKTRAFDYLFSIANLVFLPEDLISLSARCSINFHDSVLPRYAGLHATSWALMDRVAEHGVTWHVMTPRVDAGAILKQRTIPLSNSETAFSLNKKCVDAGLESFTQLIDELATGQAQFQEQDFTQRTVYGKYTRPSNGCLLIWDRDAAELNALVRSLNFGPHTNPLGVAKIKVQDDFLGVTEMDLLSTVSGNPPGTIVELNAERMVIATATQDVAIRQLLTLDGHGVPLPDLEQRFGIKAGARLEIPDTATIKEMADVAQKAAKHEEFWVKRLSEASPYELPETLLSKVRETGNLPASARICLPKSLSIAVQSLSNNETASSAFAAAFVTYLVNLSDSQRVDIAYASDTSNVASSLRRIFARQLPLRFDVKDETTFGDLLNSTHEQLELAEKKQPYLRDVVLRHPSLTKGAPQFRVEIAISTATNFQPNADSQLTLLIDPTDLQGYLFYDPSQISDESAHQVSEQFSTLVNGVAADRTLPLHQYHFLSEADRRKLLTEWNNTECSVSNACIHELFQSQVQRTPEQVALIFRDKQLTYAELNLRANQLAQTLRSCGIGPDALVGIFMNRSLELVVGLLGILKAGGAYVPLDPSYPKERLAYMLEDAKAKVVLTQPHLTEELPPNSATVITLDSSWETITHSDSTNPENNTRPEHLAYVIYTSGSTGKPKGVMLEHRNVINFFAGMDQAISGGSPGTWLAVTSISFDISVLELFWTLTRGYKVVLQEEQAMASKPLARRTSGRPVDFSLFYFASDESNGGGNSYRLLLEGAKFADQNGFAAVWTPERHFHAFGGLYPNPSVTSAAVAAVTQHVQIRAGSVVLPLHSPIRVAEEWSVVDNLSNGRVGISFASGWQANDFVLAPDNYRDNKAIMLREIETVRKLWRGEPVKYRNGKGEEVPIKILPRPRQKELPCWITAAGNPETFRSAGELGLNLLTHLLGQSLEELNRKVAIYREAWQKSGRPGKGHVTLMLHTYVGETMEHVREKVRKPFSDYLKSSVDLIKNAPSAFPTFKKPRPTADPLDQALKSDAFTAEDMEALVAHAFERYFETSALFGTPETCMRMINQLKEIGIDEVACLIDFGVDADSAIEGLRLLSKLREQSNESQEEEAADYSISAQIARHRVTHFQCTPSMARMLLATPEGKTALASLQKLFVGGEALPASLVEQLNQVMKGRIYNMYGPTETTVWSTVAPVQEAEKIHIGRPIANTQIYILDGRLKPAAHGIPGELFIGGSSVARGYLNRPELTSERFIRNPFVNDPTARIYRTGDLARYLPNGDIEYLGRLDNQVKIRGHRIEISEIESALERHPEIREAAVVAREDEQGVKYLAAFYVAKPRLSPAVQDLRSHLSVSLPDYMIPQVFMSLEAMPLTPNGKINRRALPTTEQVSSGRNQEYAAPRNATEEELASIWAKELGVERVGINDNFFDLGGNSLLAVQIAFRIRTAFHVNLPLHAFFDFPTIAGLAGELEQKLVDQADDSKLEELLAEIEQLSDDQIKAPTHLQSAKP